MTSSELSVVLSAVGVAISAVAVLSTVLIWRAEVLRRREDEGRARRRDLVSRVLQLAERVARSSTIPSIARVWFRPELEFALLLPRLYYELDPNERVIAEWVATQVRKLQVGGYLKGNRLHRHGRRVSLGILGDRRDSARMVRFRGRRLATP